MREPPEMRNPAAANGRAYRKELIIKHEESTESAAELQARRIGRLYAVSYATAATIARLAYEVVR